MKTTDKQRAELVRQKQAEWLGLNNIGQNITQSPEFAAMFRVYDKKFAPIERRTYLKRLDGMFDSMINGIIKLVDTNRAELAGIDETKGLNAMTCGVLRIWMERWSPRI